MKTIVPKAITGAERKWYIIDAKDQILGKLAVEIANALRGKNKVIFTPHLDQGDFVVVINAEKVALTGKKLVDKKYYSHTRYMGHLREASAGEILEKDPEKLIRFAVRGMLPKNKLRFDMLKRLKVYTGDKHEHVAQKPVELKISESRKI